MSGLDDKALVRLVFETGQLREEARHGWLRIYERPESVAEHTQRACVLGYLLAHREGFPDPNRIAAMILFHDLHETRTGDADRVQRRYVTLDERRAIEDQLAGLGAAGDAIIEMWEEVEANSSVAGRIAKDAEVLEMAFTARELVVRGNTDAQEWIEGLRPRLTTNSAKELLEVINVSDPSEWWREARAKQPD